MTEKNIEILKQVVFSQDKQVAQQAVEQLIVIGGEEVVNFFATLSQLENLELRNLAVSALTQISKKEEVISLMQEVYSQDLSKSDQALNRLEVIGGEEVFQFLISLIESDNARLRDGAAYILRDMGDSRAVDPLLKAITKKENKNYTESMAYALETLDCSQKLNEIFELLFYQDGLNKASAQTILNKQEFEFDREDLFKIQAQWEDCKQHPEKCPSFKEWKEWIEDSVEGFLAYLKEE